MNFDGYQLDGDPTPWSLPDGRLMPVVTRAGEENLHTADSGDALRISGVSIQHTPAQRLWYGKVKNLPGFRSVAHHHGEAETGGYVLLGRARIYYGADYEEYVDMEQGDFVFVPPVPAPRGVQHVHHRGAGLADHPHPREPRGEPARRDRRLADRLPPQMNADSRTLDAALTLDEVEGADPSDCGPSRHTPRTAPGPRRTAAT